MLLPNLSTKVPYVDRGYGHCIVKLDEACNICLYLTTTLHESRSSSVRCSVALTTGCYHCHCNGGRLSPVWSIVNASRKVHFAETTVHQTQSNNFRPRCWWLCMMTSSNGNIVRVTGHLCREFTGLRWIPRTKASDAELWCFLWSVREYTIE